MDALMVDLDLSGAREGSDPVNYHGSTLASEMRMQHPACPIILVTRPHLTATKWQQEYLRQSNSLDLIINKDDVISEPDEQRHAISALAAGFKSLDRISGQDWEHSLVRGLMEATESEENQLREAAPPVSNNQWNVPQAAKWIREVVMGFPGILYDDLTAATRLGITLDSFKNPQVQEMMDSSRYRGVFGEYQERWWRNRLLNVAQTIMLECGVSGPVSDQFREAFGIQFSIGLDPAICIVDGTPTADWVCHVLRKPVKQQNSVPYYPDSRPSVMDQARVSFAAIKGSNAFDETLVDADSLDLVHALWEEDSH
ncbi:MAG TPA: hypothetical protein VFQ47_00740 [Nitrososphaera sp.]|jgi:hypothetical protein|nr:hypothetical protein [Nitrososphaera sp.]